jgi:hypothetical protein
MCQPLQLLRVVRQLLRSERRKPGLPWRPMLVPWRECRRTVLNDHIEYFHIDVEYFHIDVEYFHIEYLDQQHVHVINQHLDIDHNQMPVWVGDLSVHMGWESVEFDMRRLCRRRLPTALGFTVARDNHWSTSKFRRVRRRLNDFRSNVNNSSTDDLNNVSTDFNIFNDIAPIMLPLYINNFNRLEPVRQLLKDFKRLHAVTPLRITIVDNDSTYPPLLEWYESLKQSGDVHIYHGPNNGPRGFWPAMDHVEPFYAMCDPDVSLGECPDDLFAVLERGLEDPTIAKTGPGIRVDDIPHDGPLYDHILRVERPFMTVPYDAQFWRGQIDCQFYMSRTGENFAYGPALRSMAPYEIRHLPYYYLPGQLTDEERWYLINLPAKHKTGLYWSTIMQDTGMFKESAAPNQPAGLSPRSM